MWRFQGSLKIPFRGYIQITLTSTADDSPEKIVSDLVASSQGQSSSGGEVDEPKCRAPVLRQLSLIIIIHRFVPYKEVRAVALTSLHSINGFLDPPTMAIPSSRRPPGSLALTICGAGNKGLSGVM